MAKSDPSGPLLFDTHIWVWYVEGARDRFSRRVEPAVEAAVDRREVLVSAISVWEIAQLEARGRLELSQDIRAWVARALAFPGVRLKAVSPAVAIDSTRLPGTPHGDPADRMLIATARLTGATLITCDTQILTYAKAGHLRTLDARR